MSDLNDPRVLFAALMTDAAKGGRGLAAAVGIAFLLLGVLLNIVSVVHYRRAVASLRPAEIPARYWPNLAVLTSLAVAALGLLLVIYVLLAR